MTTEQYLAERTKRARKLREIEDHDKRREKAFELASEFDNRLTNHPTLITQNHYRICLECELTEGEV